MKAQVHDQDKLALVIPTLRESECLPRLLREVLPSLGSLNIPCELIVVDDDSRDGSAKIVEQVSRQDPRVRLIIRRGERGLAGAILHGWQSSDATILGVMDADLQHPPQLLPNLFSAIQDGIDLAIASRYAASGGIQGTHPLRRIVSAASIAVTLPLLARDRRARDPLSGYFLVRRRCVKNILFRPTGFKLLLEILVRGRVRTVREIPFSFGRRAAGRSKATLRTAWEYLQLLARLYLLRWRELRLAPRIWVD